MALPEQGRDSVRGKAASFREVNARVNRVTRAGSNGPLVRIVVPTECRRRLGLEAGDESIIHLEGAGPGAALRSGGAKPVRRADLLEERRSLP